MNDANKIINALTNLQTDIRDMKSDIGYLKQNTASKQDLITEREETKKIVQTETRKIVHEEIALNNKILSTILKIEIAGQTQKIMNAMKIGFGEIAQRLNKHDQEISEIKEQAGLVKTH